MPLACDFLEDETLGLTPYTKEFKKQCIKDQPAIWEKKKVLGLDKKDEIQDQSSIHVSQWLQQGVASLCQSAITATFLLPTVCSEGSPAEIKLAERATLLDQVITQGPRLPAAENVRSKGVVKIVV